MPEQESNVDEQLLSVWESVRPREASGLKFIVMDEDGNFAGQFTCDEDEHGDRYFVIQQAPRSKKWSFASNLVRTLTAEESEIPKTAVRGRQLYAEILEKAVYRVDVDQGADNYSSDSKAQRWLEKQQAKKWYEDRIQGLPGDDYIQRCTRMVDWWIKTTDSREDVVARFKGFTRNFPTDSEGYNCNQNAESDINALEAYLKAAYNTSKGDEGWIELTQAVAECAVGCLIEINEEIAENVDSKELKEHFASVQSFWDNFYDSAFAVQGSGGGASKQDSVSQQDQREGTSYHGPTRLETPAGDPIEDDLFGQCCQEALSSVIDGLKNPSHRLNSMGGFSKIPADFKFLAVLQVGIEDGHLTKEGILLYACLKAYCVSLLRKFFIIERNERLESKSIEPSDRIEQLIEERGEQLRFELESEVDKLISSCFYALRDFRSSSPAAFRISFESQLTEALDMALAGLRDAAQRSIELQSSSDIEVVESMSALMYTYAPIKLTDYTVRFAQSPWAFYELQRPCEEVLDDLVGDPRALLSRVFDAWLELGSPNIKASADQSENTPSSESSGSIHENGYSDYLQTAFIDFTRFLSDELKTNPKLQAEFSDKETIEIIGLIKSRGYLQTLVTPEDLATFIVTFDINRLLRESFSCFQESREERANAVDLPKAGPHNDKQLTQLKGAELIAEDKGLGDAVPEARARACGYLTPNGGGDVEAYYKALYEAHRAKRA